MPVYEDVLLPVVTKAEATIPLWLIILAVVALLAGARGLFRRFVSYPESR